MKKYEILLTALGLLGAGFLFLFSGFILLTLIRMMSP